MTFIDTLAATGSRCAAARAATPWSKGKKGGLESFRDLMRRDPEFAREVEDAKAIALGRVEESIATRAIKGVQRPVFQKGGLVGHETVYSDHLLLRLAQRLDPEAWGNREKVDVNVKAAVLVVNSPPKTVEEWFASHGRNEVAPDDR